MATFLVEVNGKLLIEAADKEAAKTICDGILEQRQPWLKRTYSEPTRIEEGAKISAAPMMAD